MQIEEVSNQEYKVHVINSIKKKHPDLRQASKAVTFALTYAGTWRTLVNNLGIPEEQAKAIEQRYHELYSVSDEWVDNKLNIAIQTLSKVHCGVHLSLSNSKHISPEFISILG